jgi:hypothetical protein
MKKHYYLFFPAFEGVNDYPLNNIGTFNIGMLELDCIRYPIGEYDEAVAQLCEDENVQVESAFLPRDVLQHFATFLAPGHTVNAIHVLARRED